jgi:hypothetical protein
MFATLAGLAGAPAVTIGVVADVFCARQTARGAETAIHVNAFVSWLLLLRRAGRHRPDPRLPRERLIVTQPGN